MRNELVHGCFKVKKTETGWLLVNEVNVVKKCVLVKSQRMMSDTEAAAMLGAIVAERKNLESVLAKFDFSRA